MVGGTVSSRVRHESSQYPPHQSPMLHPSPPWARGSPEPQPAHANGGCCLPQVPPATRSAWGKPGEMHRQTLVCRDSPCPVEGPRPVDPRGSSLKGVDDPTGVVPARGGHHPEPSDLSLGRYTPPPGSTAVLLPHQRGALESSRPISTGTSPMDWKYVGGGVVSARNSCSWDWLQLLTECFGLRHSTASSQTYSRLMTVALVEDPMRSSRSVVLYCSHLTTL